MLRRETYTTIAHQRPTGRGRGLTEDGVEYGGYEFTTNRNQVKSCLGKLHRRRKVKKEEDQDDEAAKRETSIPHLQVVHRPSHKIMI